MNFVEDLRLFLYLKILRNFMYFKEKDETEYSINILPMIDIIFAILSFFIISSLYLTRIDSIKVNLPKSSTAVREQNKPQIITIDNNENIYFNSREISLTNMSSIIRTNIENLEEPIVILRADTSVKHGFIVNLLDELRKIENLKIGISTEKQWSRIWNFELIIKKIFNKYIKN